MLRWLVWVKVLIPPPKRSLAMWRLGFFFHEMGFGLLSISLPLYIISPTIGGSLVHIGIMSAAALFLAIPASFFWGYVCDKTRRYKRYILISFLASTAFLYLFTLTKDVSLLIILYSAMSILHVAHESPKNVLIAELYSHEDWGKAFAFYEGFTETGWLIGLFLGFLMSPYGFGSANTLFVCAGLNLIAFVLSLILVTDPLMIFERGLVGLERTIDFTSRGVLLASRLLDGIPVDERLKKENVGLFCGGLVLFSLATSILFTPMPIFVSNTVGNAGLPASLVFAIFMLNSAGGIGGYFLAGSRSTRSAGSTGVGKIVMSRSLLAFLLIAGLELPSYNVILATTILVLLGFANAMFVVYTLSLSMELIPAGKAGMYNALIGVGGAFGSFIGPFIAQTFSFLHVFIVAGVIFFSAYVAFRFFA
jgi:MFS family permease